MRIIAPLRRRSIALVWSALAFSALGDQLNLVALGWVAVDAFGPAAGYLAAAKAGIVLLTALLGGNLADRIDRRRTMVGADLVRCAVLVLLVGAWIASGRANPWLIAVTIVVLAAGEAFFTPALQTMLPVLAKEKELLVAVNGLLDATERLGRLIAPALIAVLGALMPTMHFFTLDALTFLVSALAVATLDVPDDRRPALPVGRATIVAGLLRGFRATCRDKLLGYLLAVAGPLNGVWYAVFFLAVPLAISGYLDLPGTAGLSAYGLTFSCYGISNVVGNIIVGGRPMPVRPARLVFAGDLLIGTGIALMALTCTPVLSPAWRLPAFIAAAGIAGFGGPLKDVPAATLRQLLVPSVDMAAAMRAYLIVGSAGLLVAMVLAPVACAKFGSISVMLLAASLYVGVALVGWWRFRTGAGRPVGDRTRGE
jgi:MFS family permease